MDYSNKELIKDIRDVYYDRDWKTQLRILDYAPANLKELVGEFAIDEGIAHNFIFITEGPLFDLEQFSQMLHVLQQYPLLNLSISTYGFDSVYVKEYLL